MSPKVQEDDRYDEFVDESKLTVQSREKRIKTFFFPELSVIALQRVLTQLYGSKSTDREALTVSIGLCFLKMSNMFESTEESRFLSVLSSDFPRSTASPHTYVSHTNFWKHML